MRVAPPLEVRLPRPRPRKSGVLRGKAALGLALLGSGVLLFGLGQCWEGALELDALRDAARAERLHARQCRSLDTDAIAARKERARNRDLLRSTEFPRSPKSDSASS